MARLSEAQVRLIRTYFCKRDGTLRPKSDGPQVIEGHGQTIRALSRRLFVWKRELRSETRQARVWLVVLYDAGRQAYEALLAEEAGRNA